MELSSSAVSVKELIGEINTLRKHIGWSSRGVSSQIQREIMKVRRDVLTTLDRYQADASDRQYLEKCFRQLGELNGRLERVNSLEAEHPRFRMFRAQLDRLCCNIQLYLSEIELPGVAR
jgi:hypothetical protein